MAKIDVKIKGDEELERKFDSLKRSIGDNKKLMGQIGAFSNLQIKQRTAKGVDYQSNLFKPYSPNYKEIRKQAGRPTNKVDLNFTGSMLSALTYKQTKNKVQLFFINSSDKFGARNPEKAFYNNQTREFFALSADDISKIENIVIDYINENF